MHWLCLGKPDWDEPRSPSMTQPNTSPSASLPTGT
jgi:hypothetical protein